MVPEINTVIAGIPFTLDAFDPRPFCVPVLSDSATVQQIAFSCYILVLYL